jgi:hypothetical protein
VNKYRGIKRTLSYQRYRMFHQKACYNRAAY